MTSNVRKLTIGEWTVEPDLDLISREGDRRELRPQIMDLLVYLSDHPGEVVGTDALLENLWHGKIVTQSSLYNALNELRTALGDDPKEPRYIETIPKRGYRLIAKVQLEAPASAEFPFDSAEEKPDHRLNLVNTISLMGLLVMLGWYVVRQDIRLSTGGLPSPTAIPARSVAVLPFDDLSPGDDERYFADGLSEEILVQLAGVPGLKVSGRQSSFAVRDAQLTNSQIGSVLGVAHILEGTVRRDGDQLRITAQLIQSGDGFQVWSGTYDAEAKSILRVQNQIANSIAEALQVEIRESSHRSENVRELAQVELQVRDLMLLARDRIARGSEKDVLEAIEFLNRALALDPAYAQAHAELAWAYRELGGTQSGSEFRVNALDGPMFRHASAALELDPDLADAHAALGTIYYVTAWNGGPTIELAEQSFARAFELDPELTRGLAWYSGLTRLQGRPYMEAVELARDVVERDPFWVFMTNHYLSLIEALPAFRTQKWELVRKLNDMGEEWPGSTRSMEARLLISEGRLAEAVNLMERVESSDDTKVRVLIAKYSPWLMMGEIEPEFDPGALQQWFWDQWQVLPASVSVPRIVCSELEGFPNNTQTVSKCGHAHLLSGETDKADEFLSRFPFDDLEATDRQFRHTYYEEYGVTITLATICKLKGDPDMAETYLAMTEKLLRDVSEDYTLEATWLSRTRARLLALRGDQKEALNELERSIDMGERDFRMFMHPAFNELRELPRYQAIHRRWLGLINEERQKLGLAPLEINPEPGPGTLPFVLDS